MHTEFGDPLHVVAGVTENVAIAFLTVALSWGVAANRFAHLAFVLFSSAYILGFGLPVVRELTAFEMTKAIEFTLANAVLLLSRWSGWARRRTLMVSSIWVVFLINIGDAIVQDIRTPAFLIPNALTGILLVLHLPLPWTKGESRLFQLHPNSHRVLGVELDWGWLVMYVAWNVIVVMGLDLCPPRAWTGFMHNLPPLFLAMREGTSHNWGLYRIVALTMYWVWFSPQRLMQLWSELPAGAPTPTCGDPDVNPDAGWLNPWMNHTVPIRERRLPAALAISLLGVALVWFPIHAYDRIQRSRRVTRSTR